MKQRVRGSLPSGALSGEAGFVLWGHPEAREKVFRVIFKGYGPGPGTTSLAGAVTDLPRAAAGVREGARALGQASDQTDYMRETVELMRGKIAGVVSAVPAATAAPSAPLPSRQPVAGRTPAATAPAPSPAGRAAVEIIADWGQRCCARDIAELRAGLAAIRTASPALQELRRARAARSPGNRRPDRSAAQPARRRPQRLREYPRRDGSGGGTLQSLAGARRAGQNGHRYLMMTRAPTLCCWPSTPWRLEPNRRPGSSPA